jgi:microcompartment protein CcmK/EutM
MKIGRITGAIHSTINHPFYDGHRLLMVDLLKPDLSETGNYLIAVDTVGAGAGETVLIVDEGNSSRQIVNDSSAPLRSVIVGIVDDINLS